MQSFFLLHYLSVAYASGLLIIKLLDFSLILLSVPDAFGALRMKMCPGNGVRLDIFQIVIFLCGLPGLGMGDSLPNA